MNTNSSLAQNRVIPALAKIQLVKLWLAGMDGVLPNLQKSSRSRPEMAYCPLRGLCKTRPRPDATMGKMMDISRIRGLGWQAGISPSEGMKLTYRDFVTAVHSRAIPQECR